MFRVALGGVGLLLVQSLFGGLTVLFRLPDLVSTTHLGLALLFLGLATFLASASGRAAGIGSSDPHVAAGLRRWAPVSAGLVFAQSLLGALVRHTDAGLACPDMPLCLGRLVPPLDNGLVALHFLHRVLGIAAAAAVIGVAVWASTARAPATVRGWSTWAAVLVLVQVGLGFLSVSWRLAVLPVSLHTLVAASLFATLVHLATMGWMAGRDTPDAV
jgi:cytochrome c oxidase assembly protein subunit 15